VTLLTEIALLVAAGTVIVVCLALLPDAAPWSRRRASVLRRARPGQLDRLVRLAASSENSALQTHAYLRPLLAEIASRRLAAHGLTLERLPGTAGRGLLGDRLWELVRPDRPFPEDRYGTGVSARDLSAMLDVLERL
jgi:hypothetical protein